MRKQQIGLIQDITKIQVKQKMLLEKPKNCQQHFLHLYAHRYLISKLILHKNIDEVLSYLPSSFANIALQIVYLTYCIQNRIELQLQKYPILNLLNKWAEIYPKIASYKQVRLVQLIQNQSIQSLSNLEEYITYIELIGGDLLQIMRKPSKNQSKPNLLSWIKIPIKTTDKASSDYFQTEDLLNFISSSLPRVLSNVLLPKQMIPTQSQQQYPVFECLFKNASLQYFIRRNQWYPKVIKKIVDIIITLVLTSSQEKVLMDVVFRYFYAFHHDKKYSATDVFMRAYNKLSEQVRFALTGEFIVFIRVSQKIGKSKFIDFLIQQSDWFRQISQFISTKPVGYKKDILDPFNSIGLSQKITVEKGKTETRYFEVLQDYSLLYFKIEVASWDITLRLWYYGEIDSANNIKMIIAQKQKLSGEFSDNLIAAKRGIYAYEFDNSYSWLKSKTVKYQNIVLTPVEVQSPSKYQWIQAFYDNVPASHMASQKEKVWIIRKRKLQQAQTLKQTASIITNADYYILKRFRENKLLEYQTDSEDRLLERISTVSKQAEWNINAQPVQDLQKIKQYIINRKKIKQAVIRQEDALQYRQQDNKV